MHCPRRAPEQPVIGGALEDLLVAVDVQRVLLFYRFVNELVRVAHVFSFQGAELLADNVLCNEEPVIRPTAPRWRAGVLHVGSTCWWWLEAPIDARDLSIPHQHAIAANATR